MKFYIIKDEQIIQLIKEYYSKKQNQKITEYIPNFFDLFVIIKDKQTQEEYIAIPEDDDDEKDIKKIILLLLRDNFLKNAKKDFYIIPEEYINKILEKKEFDENTYEIKSMQKIPEKARFGLIALTDLIDPEGNNNIYEILRKLIDKILLKKISNFDVSYIIQLLNILIPNFDDENKKQLTNLLSSVKEALGKEDEKEMKKELLEIYDLILDIEEREKIKKSIKGLEELKNILDKYLDIRVYKNGTIKIVVKDKAVAIISANAITKFYISYKEYKEALEEKNENKGKKGKRKEKKISIYHFITLDTFYKILVELNYDFNDERLRKIIDYILAEDDNIKIKEDELYYEEFENHLLAIESYIVKKYLKQIKDVILFENPKEEETVYSLLNYIQDFTNNIYLYISLDDDPIEKDIEKIRKILETNDEVQVMFYIKGKSLDTIYLILKTKFLANYNLSKYVLLKFFWRENILTKFMVLERNEGNEEGYKEKDFYYVIDLNKLLEKLKIDKDEYIESLKKKAENINAHALFEKLKAKKEGEEEDKNKEKDE